MATLKDENTLRSTVTLANATELVTQLVQSIVGNDVSDSVNGNRLTPAMIRTLAQTRFRHNLEARQP